MTGDRFFDSVRSLGITRSSDAPLAGVCAGLAKRWNVDPLLVRAIAVALALLGGIAITLYAIGWILLPDEEEKIHAQEPFYGQLSASFVFAVILIFSPLSSMSLGFSSNNWVFGPFGFFIAIIIVAIVAITMHGKDNSQREGQPAYAEHMYATSQQSDPSGGSSYNSASGSSYLPESSGGEATPGGESEGAGATSGSSGPTNPAGPPGTGPSGTGPSDTAAFSTNRYSGTAGSPQDRYAPQDQPVDRTALYTSDREDKKDKRPVASSRTFLLILALILILVAGIMLMLDQGIIPRDTNFVIGAFAGATILLGIVVTIFGISGRRGGAVSVIAIISAALVFPSAGLLTIPAAENHIIMGERSWSPSSAAQAEGGFSSLMGDLEVDVTGLTEAEFEVIGRMSDVSIVVDEDQKIAVITDYTMSDITGLDRRSDTSGVGGDHTYYIGDIDSVDEADIVIHVDLLMSSFTLER